MGTGRKGGGSTGRKGPAWGGKLIIYNKGKGGGEINGLKNLSEKCEGRGGVDGVKNRSGQWEGPGGEEFNKCIMHQVHTSVYNKIFKKWSHV